MTAFLIWIKHHCQCLWIVIEQFNILLLRVIWGSRIIEVKKRFLRKELPFGYFRLLVPEDTEQVVGLLKRVTEGEKQFFKPHGFDWKSVNAVLKSIGFLSFGFFVQDKLVGYFILRLFCMKKSFIGRYVIEDMRNKGVGKEMASMLYDLASALNFEVYSTISEKNLSSLKSHQAMGRMRVVEELPNNYVLVKIVPSNET